MAPEQMRGGEEVDARADIWSLGVVLYELCTGRSPFFGETIAAICARVIGDEPAAPRALKADLPSGLSAIILRCLRKDRAQRPSDIAELAASLAAFGSADADVHATSALRVFSNARTNPALQAASSERTPTALSATLAVLGQRLYPRRPLYAQPRVQLVGAALAFATLLGGAFTLRAGHASERAAGPSPGAQAVAPHLSAITSCAMPGAAARFVPAVAVTPPAKGEALPSAKPPVTLTRGAAKGRVRNPWDPKSFGGRL
jgi:serine/threonine-protein kinase